MDGGGKNSGKKAESKCTEYLRICNAGDLQQLRSKASIFNQILVKCEISWQIDGDNVMRGRVRRLYAKYYGSVQQFHR